MLDYKVGVERRVDMTLIYLAGSKICMDVGAAQSEAGGAYQVQGHQAVLLVLH